jgi:E3 ubiquitin-protein ligase UBR4
VAALKPIKPRKLKKNVRIKTSSSPHFPIDFFEHCQVLNDVEFGGKDILQVYNVQQVKHRLMTAGMYIACTKVTIIEILSGAKNVSLVLTLTAVCSYCNFYCIITLSKARL